MKKFWTPLLLLTAFIIWTILIQYIDTQPIGPLDSAVGFATMNQYVHQIIGVHMALYAITDWLGLVPIAFMLGFAVLGLCQWITRRHLLRVDFSILTLGIYYGIVFALYIFFEMYVINYRPILIAGFLEASYPSSTTMLTLCVMPTAIYQLNIRITQQRYRLIIQWILTVFTAFMVLGRLISGVHWVTDIIGGILLSAGLVSLYRAINQQNIQKERGE